MTYAKDEHWPFLFRYRTLIQYGFFLSDKAKEKQLEKGELELISLSIEFIVGLSSLYEHSKNQSKMEFALDPEKDGSLLTHWDRCQGNRDSIERP